MPNGGGYYVFFKFFIFCAVCEPTFEELTAAATVNIGPYRTEPLAKFITLHFSLFQNELCNGPHVP